MELFGNVSYANTEFRSDFFTSGRFAAFRRVRRQWPLCVDADGTPGEPDARSTIACRSNNGRRPSTLTTT